MDPEGEWYLSKPCLRRFRDRRDEVGTEARAVTDVQVGSIMKYGSGRGKRREGTNGKTFR